MSPKENEQSACGSSDCRQIIDAVASRMESALSRQHGAGIESIKDLMTLHHNTVRDSLAEIKQTAKTQSDEIFNRLRKVEERQSIHAAMAMTETKVREIVENNSGVRWAKGQKAWVRAVWTAASIAMLLAAWKVIVLVAAQQVVK